MDRTVIDSGSIIKNSIIGENVLFSGKINSKKNCFSAVNGKKIKIAEEFGVVVADNVKAKNVLINAGCKIWPNKSMLNKTITGDAI